MKIPQEYPEKNKNKEAEAPLRRMDALRSENLQQIVFSLDDVEDPTDRL